MTRSTWPDRLETWGGYVMLAVILAVAALWVATCV